MDSNHLPVFMAQMKWNTQQMVENLDILSSLYILLFFNFFFRDVCIQHILKPVVVTFFLMEARKTRERASVQPKKKWSMTICIYSYWNGYVREELTREINKRNKKTVSGFIKILKKAHWKMEQAYAIREDGLTISWC